MSDTTKPKRSCGAVRILVGVGLVAWLHADEANAASAPGAIITNVASVTSWCYGDFSVSYAATATVKIFDPGNICFQQFATPPDPATGGVVTFSVVMVNTTIDSVWGLTVTSRLPDGMVFNANPGNGGFVPETDSAWNAGNWYGGGTPAPPDVVSLGYGSTPAPPMVSGPPPDGQASPLFLKWTVPYLGPARSAAVSYAASVL